MYVEAPEASKTVSLSLSLSTPTVHWAGGKRNPGHTCLLTTHHNGLKQCSALKSLCKTSRKAVGENPTAKNSCTGRILRVELHGDSTTYRNRTIALVGSLPGRM